MLAKIILAIKVSLLRRVGFWSSGLFDFAYVNGSLMLVPSEEDLASKWVVIVDREHYFESDRDYPIGHIRDLRKVLKNEPWRFPYAGRRFNRIERISDQSHRVTSWVVKQSVADQFSKTITWLVPETACVRHLLSMKIFVLNRLGRKVYIRKTGGGVVSSSGYEKSMLYGGGIPLGGGVSAPSAGEIPAEALDSLTAEQTCFAFFDGLVRLAQQSPFQFVCGYNPTFLKDYPWSKVGKLSATAAVAYLLITSVYIVGAGAWIDFKIQAQEVNAESALELKGRLFDYQDDLEEIQTVFAGITPLWFTWDVLLDLSDFGASFRGVNFLGSDLTYFLSATRATEVLDILNENPLVQHAGYALPVRQEGNTQRFAVNVSFVSESVTLPAASEAVDDE